MDKLSLERQQVITKTSTEKLRKKLIQYGNTAETVQAMDRATLMDAYADMMLETEASAEAAEAAEVKESKAFDGMSEEEMRLKRLVFVFYLATIN